MDEEEDDSPRRHGDTEASSSIIYKGLTLDCGYRMDFVIEEKIVLEAKSVEKLVSIHEAQLLTYLKLSGFRIGLMINFNAAVIRSPLIRRVL